MLFPASYKEMYDVSIFYGWWCEPSSLRLNYYPLGFSIVKFLFFPLLLIIIWGRCLGIIEISCFWSNVHFLILEFISGSCVLQDKLFHSFIHSFTSVQPHGWIYILAYRLCSNSFIFFCWNCSSFGLWEFFTAVPCAVSLCHSLDFWHHKMHQAQTVFSEL